VNQNMRHDTSVRAARTLLENGTIGEPVFATINMRAIPHWMDWHKDLGWQSTGPGIWRHRGRLLPPMVEAGNLRIAFRVEDLDQLLAAIGQSGQKIAPPGSPFRHAVVCANGGATVEAVERHGWQHFHAPPANPRQSRRARIHQQIFRTRRRSFLRNEAGIVHAERLVDRTRHAVNAFSAAHPSASFADVFDRFFRGYQGAVPLRIISGRNVEAAGTKTVQILFEGCYDAYFVPNEHYIPLEKDFSNADEAIRKFRDLSFSSRLVDNAYSMVLESLTYPKLIDRLRAALGDLL